MLVVSLVVGGGCQKKGIGENGDGVTDTVNIPNPPIDSFDDDPFWWPEQKKPSGIVVCKQASPFATHVLSQSLVGLTAQAVNDGNCDEMVWIKTSTAEVSSYWRWIDMVCTRVGAQKLGEYNVWDLVDRYKEKGVVKGYILYKADESIGDTYDASRVGVNMSVNVATVYAGLLKGVLIDESLEAMAISHGLEKLYDAREESVDSCFYRNKDKLNNKLIVGVDPKVAQPRSTAIAYKTMVLYGTTGISEKIMEWVKPLSPFFGWNCGSEYEQTSLPTKYACFNTATSSATNIPVLMAGNKEFYGSTPKFKSLDPSKIDFSDKSSTHSFVMSDGDNIMWQTGTFAHHPEYWGNSSHLNGHTFPMGWTSVLGSLSMVSSETYDYMVKTQPLNTSVVEYGGGYQYPDYFASGRANREELQRKFARLVNSHMKRTGVKVFGFICRNVFSEESRKAFQIYAEEMDGIVGMIAVQYNPYNGGKGEIIWVKNRKGVEIPVVTSSYSIWAKLKTTGQKNPQIVADSINAKASQAINLGIPTYGWTMTHAWSYFNKAVDGSISDSQAGSGVRGYDPTLWCVERLNSNVKVVSVEEMIWRIRHQYNPSETLQNLQ